jgi:acetylornithine/succinyldiaminopimelate/putrescine aminotransferase
MKRLIYEDVLRVAQGLHNKRVLKVAQGRNGRQNMSLNTVQHGNQRKLFLLLSVSDQAKEFGENASWQANLQINKSTAIFVYVIRGETGQDHRSPKSTQTKRA